MATWRCDTANLHSTWTWEANHVYASGDKVVCTWYGPNYTTGRARLFECTTGGTSGGSEPTWDTTVGNTTTDNTVTWTTRDPTSGNWSHATVLRYAWEKAAAGDTIYVDDGHNEKWASINFDVRYNVYTARDNPIKVFCVDKADDSLSSGAVFGTSNAAANTLGLNDSFYSYGITFTSGGSISLGASGYTFASMCIEGTGPGFTVFEIGTTGTSNYLYSGNAYPVRVIIRNGDIKLNNAGNYIGTSQGTLHWYNGVLVAPNETTYLVSGYMGLAVIEDVDLSAMCAGATSRYLIQDGSSSMAIYLFKRCKFPSGAGFAIQNRASYQMTEFGVGSYPRLIIDQCSSGTSLTVTETHDRWGDTIKEATLIKTGGASDGTAGFAFKMVSTSLAKDGLHSAHASPVIAGVLDVATSQTVTVDCLVDSATNLQNDEVWMEISYPKNAGDVLGARATDRFTPLDTPADHASSTATWTTTGMSNPNEFKLEITFDPGQVGPYEIRVFLSKPSTTIYVDPKPAFA